MNRGLRASCLLPLCLLACRSPQAAPSEGPEVVAARAAGEAATFQEGFIQGARMVPRALELRRIPYHPCLDRTRAFLPVADPAKAPMPAPVVEVHSVSGLPLKDVGEANPFEAGRLAGFEWGLARYAPGRWAAKALPGGPKEVPPFAEAEGPGFRIWREGDTLSWALGDQGFPPRLRWRKLPVEWGAEGASFEGGVLWVSTRAGLLALDPDEGWILAVLSPLPAPLTATEREARRVAEHRRRLEAGEPAALREEASLLGEAGLPLLHRAAQAGDPQALVDLGLRYLHGSLGAPKDDAKAWELLGRAAKAGSLDAAAILEAHARGEL